MAEWRDSMGVWLSGGIVWVYAEWRDSMGVWLSGGIVWVYG